MKRIILEVDDSVGKKWRAASSHLRVEMSKLIEKQIDKAIDGEKDRGDILLDSPALPGTPLSLKVFKDWISEAEKNGTKDIIDAKKIWVKKRSQLKKLLP